MVSNDLDSLVVLAPGNNVSRSSTPMVVWQEANGEANGVDIDSGKETRSRPRTYPYFKYLPYPTESETEKLANLDVCIRNLYTAVASGDFAPGAVHWTREIRGWLQLKFDMPRETRVKLVKLYYELSLAPGLDPLVSERFASMFMILTKRKHYLRPGKDLYLDWRPLYKELKVFVLPSEYSTSHSASIKRNYRTLTKLCTFAQIYFDPREIPAMFEEFLPFFSTSFTETSYVVIGLLNLLMPTYPATEDIAELQPQHYLPTFFHLWSLINRSRSFDVQFIDICSRLARDNLHSTHVPFAAYGLFTEEQSGLIFTAILRILEIPVGSSNSAYSSSVDLSTGLAIMLERDSRKHPITHHIARWVVMSLSPYCLDKPNSILANLETLVQSVETFFHPSNSGHWTKTLPQLVYYLADFFVMRWNRERSGEMEVPEDRRLNEEVRRRFVLALRDVTFMSIYSKSGTAMSFSLSTLQCLAFLEPNLILPGALQRIYPAMQGLVEVHRTISSIRALQMLAKVMVRTKGYRCHVTSLLGLALPGIDPNDLEKTIHTLQFIQAVCYNAPFFDLTKEKVTANGAVDSENGVDGIDSPSEQLDTGIAVNWITGQVERLEQEGADIVMNYDDEISDQEEETILRSSTAGLAEFVTSFLGRVFTLLQNLPDASRVRSGSPEENVVNTLPATFTPLLAALSPELYEITLNKIAQFVTNNVVHQARDAMAFICNAMVKIDPEKALQRLLPEILDAIRTEINENGAGSTRTTGSEVLPRDRALVWHISMLAMCVVNVGDSVLKWKSELSSIATFMQARCKGIPTVHVSNFIHHLLLNLAHTYALDFSIYEPGRIERGLVPSDWGTYENPQNLSVKWHKPSPEEIKFAMELFSQEAHGAMDALKGLIGDSPPIKRDGTGKEWSDEVSRNLVLIRLILSGVSVLFDPQHAASDHDEEDDEAKKVENDGAATPMDLDAESTDDEFALGTAEDDEVRPTFQYETGYPLEKKSERYRDIHDLREIVGHTLHQVHEFLVGHQEDDVQCFNSLYTAYRSWFVDVGIERSAHILDRVNRLLAADTHPYKFSGLRKEYPRPLLVRRAYVYHLQRLRHNAHANPRPKSELEEQLLLDLAHSSVSLYTEIRRTAQSANESAVKCIIGARPLVIPPLLKALEGAVNENDFPRIKGAMFSLLFGSLAKTIGRDWRYTPRLVKAFIEVTNADKPSIQKLASNATFQIMDMGKPMERMVILDQDIVESIASYVDKDTSKAISDRISKKKAVIQSRREKVEGKKAQLAEELIVIARTSHWKKSSRAAALVISLSMRFDTIASPSMIELITNGSVDPHPNLRGLYTGSFLGLFGVIHARSICKHDYKTYLLMEEDCPDKISVPTKAEDPAWTDEFLGMFSRPDTKYYVDHDYPGWLVWKKSLPAYLTDPPQMNFDETEQSVRGQVGKLLTKTWFEKFFAYMKQEPRDSSTDRFHSTFALILTHSFDLMFAGVAAITFEEMKELAKDVFGDGSDKHQHRATAEILAGLAICAFDQSSKTQTEIWEYIFPIVRGVFKDGLTPENSQYWNVFLHLLLQGKDPRRVWPLVDWLTSYRLDMTSHAAFKESSKILLLNQVITQAGWHFQLEKPILADLMGHLDHPYKAVREAMGVTIASIYRSRHHESYPDVKSLIQAQKSASPIGTRPFEPTEEFSSTMKEVFDRLDVWRKAHPPGQQEPTSYTSGAKTILLWLDSTLSSFECIQLVKFFPDMFMEQLLHMMDIKEDPELQALAFHVFRQLPNIPHRDDEEAAFIAALIRIGRTATSWHQRLRVLINMQVIYFRRLFLMSEAQQLELLECVSAMLADVQLEVRLGAATTLSGMVKCSPAPLRDRMIRELKIRFTDMLRANPLPKRRAGALLAERVSTPTPEQNRLTVARHSAVLGLGALVQAFPYTSPPPSWLPEVLATLALKAAGDSGVVGKGVKGILADFKKTRQDTWHVDVKAFEPEQLEDLEGVLWKSYFA